MNRFICLLAGCVLSVPLAAWASVFLLAPSGESLKLECRDKSLYLAYQLDSVPACYEFSCTSIRARTDDSEWIQYSAHNGRHNGFVRNKRSTFRKNGDVAEALLARMLEASSVAFFNPGTGKPVAFSIGDADRPELKAVAAQCGATGS